MTKVKLIPHIFASFLFGLLLSVSHAQSFLAWEQLTADEQKILTPYAKNWPQMSAENQTRLQKVARNWAKMTPEQRIAMQQRSEQWKKMSEETKQKLRERYHQFEQATPQQQQKIIQRMNKFRALPEQDRKALRHRWQQSLQPNVIHDANQAPNKEQLRTKKDTKVISNKDNIKSESNGEMNKPDEAAEESNNSRLNNGNRIQNNRLDHQRITDL